MSSTQRIGPERFQRDATGVHERGGFGRAAMAGVALLVLVVGVPLLVVWLDAVPSIPTSLPTREDITGAIGAEQLITVLVWVAALAWVQFTICLLVELKSAISGVGLPSRVPLSGPSQRLARVLVGSVMLAVTATGQAANAVTPATTHDEPIAAKAVVELAHEPAAEAAPARDTAGPAAWTAQVPDGANATYFLGDAVIDDDDAKDLVGRKVYRVQPPEGRYHDNLWDIAERHLGDGRRYKEIYELNRGRLQPDGSELSLARLIYPNWLLIMPNDATDVQRVTAVVDEPPEAKPAPEKPAPEPAQDERAGSDAGQDASADASGETAEDAGGVQTDQLVGTGLLAAGLLAAIELVRRRRRTPEPDDAEVETEVALRIGADDDRARWLDKALRSLSATCREQGIPLPPVYAVMVDSSTIELALAPASPGAPSPWTVLDEGRRWRLERSDDLLLQDHVDNGRDVVAPYPGLVSLGRGDGDRDVLVDLEAAGGPIAVVGDPRAAHEVVTAIAAELATNVWSDHLRVTASGLPEELTALNEERYRSVEDLAGVLPELASRRAAQLGGDVLSGRVRAGGSSVWMPEYVVVGREPNEKLAHDLTSLTSGTERSPLGVVCAGELSGARWRASVDAAGNLELPALGLRVRANRLSHASAASVASLIKPPEPSDPTLHEAWLPEARPEVPEAAIPVDESALATAPVRVFVLGPAEVQAPGAIDDSRRELATEMVIYLALHREGAHPSVLSGAVWPGGVTASVREATIARVRDWLGTDPEGSPHLLVAPDGRLRLSDDVVLDWDVVKMLLRHSRETSGRQEEFALLRRALRVARGQVLESRPRGRYSWIARARMERAASDLLVDAAHRLSVLCLEAGDLGTSAAAARAGLRVRPAEQLLWRDLLAAENAREGTVGVTAVTNELTDSLGALGVVDLEPETMALIDELLPSTRRDEGWRLSS